jgi:hypothetical protein
MTDPLRFIIDRMEYIRDLGGAELDPLPIRARKCLKDAILQARIMAHTKVRFEADEDEVRRQLGPADGGVGGADGEWGRELCLWRLVRATSLERSDQSVRGVFVQTAAAFIAMVAYRNFRLAIGSTLACCRGKAEWSQVMPHVWLRVFREMYRRYGWLDRGERPWPAEFESLGRRLNKVDCAWLRAYPLDTLDGLDCWDMPPCDERSCP